MKRFCSWITAHVGGKQLSAVFAILALAIVLSRNGSQPSTSVDASDAALALSTSTSLALVEDTSTAAGHASSTEPESASSIGRDSSTSSGRSEALERHTSRATATASGSAAGSVAAGRDGAGSQSPVTSHGNFSAANLSSTGAGGSSRAAATGGGSAGGGAGGVSGAPSTFSGASGSTDERAEKSNSPSNTVAELTPLPALVSHDEGAALALGGAASGQTDSDSHNLAAVSDPSATDVTAPAFVKDLAPPGSVELALSDTSDAAPKVDAPSATHVPDTAGTSTLLVAALAGLLAVRRRMV